MRSFIKLMLLGCFLSSISAICSAQTSVLGNIDCGGGQATCFQQKSGVSGAVRCTCSATCLSSACVTKTVASTRAFQWGMPPVQPCIFSVTGTATGGTTATSNPSTQTAVFTTNSITGLVIGTTSSKQVVDCFAGTIQDDPLIGAICA
jgi:hypothetical protein